MTATTVLTRPDLGFTLDRNEAHEPPEAHGVARDGVRLLVSEGDAEPIDAHFSEIGTFLAAGDLLVVNTSATVPAALDGRLPNGDVVVHLSGPLPGGVWLVEVRQPRDGATAPLQLDHAVDVALLAGGTVRLLAPFADSVRLWLAQIDVPAPLASFVAEHGRPIRYRHVERDWPLSAYQTVFAHEPGSAEMPSASRAFTPEVVTDLVGRGVLIAPSSCTPGVSSLESDEAPYPERYAVPASTASVINAVRASGGRVIAAGTTVVRALVTATDDHGVVHPAMVGPRSSCRPTCRSAIDGLLTGWHEPESTHLMMLEAFASRDTLAHAYRCVGPRLPVARVW